MDEQRGQSDAGGEAGGEGWAESAERGWAESGGQRQTARERVQRGVRSEARRRRRVSHGEAERLRTEPQLEKMGDALHIGDLA